jgi:hypothetical protein
MFDQWFISILIEQAAEKKISYLTLCRILEEYNEFNRLRIYRVHD